jgi:hypothetical protein
MDRGIRSTIARIAGRCNKRDDFENRIRESIGSDLVAEALRVYDEIHGEIWGLTYPTNGAHLKAKPRKFEFLVHGVCIPLSTVLVALTAVVEIIAFLFPPYSIQLSQGLTKNLGFHFLFNPPAIGKIEANVWGVEFLAILIIGALCFIFVRFVERLSEAH